MVSLRSALSAACLPLLAAAAAPPGQPAPRGGAPSFVEDFRTFDHGTDQVRPARPHRWRTVFGYGGALAVHNRELSGTSIAMSPEFAGVRAANRDRARWGSIPSYTAPAS